MSDEPPLEEKNPTSDPHKSPVSGKQIKEKAHEEDPSSPKPDEDKKED